MAEVVYGLCALTSFACAFLLVRGWWRSRVRLLLWSAVCFVGLALNNIGLFIDLVILPETIDLSLWRTVPAVIGMSVLVCALAWEDL
jgi:hypothetical protein